MAVGGVELKARLWSKANIRNPLPVPSGSVNKKDEVKKSGKSDNSWDFTHSNFITKGLVLRCVRATVIKF